MKTYTKFTQHKNSTQNTKQTGPQQRHHLATITSGGGGGLKSILRVPYPPSSSAVEERLLHFKIIKRFIFIYEIDQL